MRENKPEREEAGGGGGGGGGSVAEWFRALVL